MIPTLLQPLKVSTINDPTDTTTTVSVGVTQGSSLSPILFNIYIDGLSHALQTNPRDARFAQASLLADDGMLMASDASTMKIRMGTCNLWEAEHAMERWELNSTW